MRLRAAAANGRGLGVVDAARYLFALDERAPTPRRTTRPRDRHDHVDDALMPTHHHGRRGLHRLARRRALSRRRLDRPHHRQPRHRQAGEPSRRARPSTSSTSATRRRRSSSPRLQARRARASRGADGRAPERRAIRCSTRDVNILGSLNLLEAVREHSPSDARRLRVHGRRPLRRLHDAAELRGLTRRIRSRRTRSRSSPSSTTSRTTGACTGSIRSRCGSGTCTVRGRIRMARPASSRSSAGACSRDAR